MRGISQKLKAEDPQKLTLEDVNRSFRRDVPQELKVKDVSFRARCPFKNWKLKMWKRSFRASLPSHTESLSCENEAFVRDSHLISLWDLKLLSWQLILRSSHRPLSSPWDYLTLRSTHTEIILPSSQLTLRSALSHLNSWISLTQKYRLLHFLWIYDDVTC